MLVKLKCKQRNVILNKCLLFASRKVGKQAMVVVIVVFLVVIVVNNILEQYCLHWGQLYHCHPQQQWQYYLVIGCIANNGGSSCSIIVVVMTCCWQQKWTKIVLLMVAATSIPAKRGGTLSQVAGVVASVRAPGADCRW